MPVVSGENSAGPGLSLALVARRAARWAAFEFFGGVEHRFQDPLQRDVVESLSVAFRRRAAGETAVATSERDLFGAITRRGAVHAGRPAAATRTGACRTRGRRRILRAAAVVPGSMDWDSIAHPAGVRLTAW